MKKLAAVLTIALSLVFSSALADGAGAGSPTASPGNKLITPKVIDSFNTKLVGKMFKVEVGEVSLQGCEKPVQIISAPGFPLKTFPMYVPPVAYAKDQWPTAIKQGLECDIRRFFAQLSIWYPGKDGRAKATLQINPFASGSYYILANPVLNTDKSEFDMLTEPCWGGSLVGLRQTNEPIDAYVYGRELGTPNELNIFDASIRAQGRLAWRVQNDPDCQKRFSKIGVLFAPTQWNPTITTVTGPSGMNGQNGRGIVSIKLVGTQFIATYTDGTTDVVGEIQTPQSANDGAPGADGRNGRGIDRIVIEGGNIVAYYTDNTSSIVGPAPKNGLDGKPGSDGKNCFDDPRVGDYNRDGVKNVADCNDWALAQRPAPATGGGNDPVVTTTPAPKPCDGPVEVCACKWAQIASLDLGNGWKLWYNPTAFDRPWLQAPDGRVTGGDKIVDFTPTLNPTWNPEHGVYGFVAGPNVTVKVTWDGKVFSISKK
jgi:hypothetical protein